MTTTTTIRLSDIRTALRAIDPGADFKVSRYDTDDDSITVTTDDHRAVAKAADWLEANGFEVARTRRGRVRSEVYGGRWDFRHRFVAYPIHKSAVLTRARFNAPASASQ